MITARPIPFRTVLWSLLFDYFFVCSFVCVILVFMGMGTIHNRVYSGIIVGIAIRGTIAKTRIFRVRWGNGYYASVLGLQYQDQYAYFVPGSINNVQSEPYRRQWISAVAKWKYDLTAEQKAAYNGRATKGLRISGYNLFMREAMKGLVDMYVDRGDPAAYDFAVGDFTKDGTWYDLDLSGIIPVSAKAVLLEFDIETVNREKHIRIRKYGNANVINHQDIETFNGGIHQSGSVIVAVDYNRIIKYNIDVATWTELDMVIRGWWT